MNTQIWIGEQRPESQLFRPVENGSGEIGKPKPGTGLWTSTWDGKGGDWFRWCSGEDFGEWRTLPWWLLDVDQDANVLEIATVNDMSRLIDAYGEPRKNLFWFIDWERIAKEWDGVHLADYAIHWRYENSTMHQVRPFEEDFRIAKGMVFYGWDCECTLWFRWAFSNVRQGYSTNQKCELMEE